MLTRLDVADYDDTELGAEVRAAFAAGVTTVILYDGRRPNRLAMKWPDGLHGLWRLECPKGHVWLSAREKGVLLQRECPECTRVGLPVG